LGGVMVIASCVLYGYEKPCVKKPDIPKEDQTELDPTEIDDDKVELLAVTST
jgi:hypothetical protein